MTDVQIEVILTCQRVGCWNAFIATLGPGRPRRYCCDGCRRQATNDRKRAQARLDTLRGLTRREEHLLAAMGEDPAPPVPAALTAARDDLVGIVETVLAHHGGTWTWVGPEVPSEPVVCACGWSGPVAEHRGHQARQIVTALTADGSPT